MVKSKMTREEFVEFNTELERLRNIKWKGYRNTLKEVGISYLGNVAQSSKLMHSFIHHINTYCVYLASADLSGFNVCPNSKMCKDNCLMGSGHNKLSRMSGNDNIDRPRIIKTRLLIANKLIFMKLFMHEVEVEMRRAEVMGHDFSIRLNPTSDLSPDMFTYGKKNVLQLYPKVPIYDYTKVPSRLRMLDKYPNYDITWSLDGSEENEKIAKEYLEKGGRVAVVFGDAFPKKFLGFDVIDGDAYDARYKDGNVIVGLAFKKTANNHKNGKFVMPKTDFIVRNGDKRGEW